MSNEKNIKDAPELETEKTPEFDINGYEVVSEDEVNEVMKKYDRESNTRIWVGVPHRAVQIVMALFSLYCIYSTLFSTASLERRMTAFLGCVIIMGFLYYPASKHHVRPNFMPWYDIIIMVVGAGCFFYYCFVADDLIKVLSSASKMTTMYNVIAIVGILVLMELCRRCVGVPILVVVAVLLFYTFGVANLTLERALYTLFYRTGGVIGTPIQVCAKFIVVFIVFGAFLERTGISKFFIDLANKIAGASAGGPAKVAVISSALCGMVSGSSVGNTVTTGSVTIPMMKKTGYKPDFAGAVEAAASTGGQIMPPIMGAAAFLMAEYIGISYGEVALKAILPAFLYFAGIFIAVHLEAKKLGLKGISRAEMVPGKELAKQCYLLIPIVLLVVLVSVNACTMQRAATYSILAAIVVGLVNRDAKLTPMKFVEALEAGGKGTITVAVACSMAGVIAGCITATGLASKLISAIVALSGNTLIIGLFLTMVCCIILGMGVPTTANYCIMAATCAPILVKLGVPQVAAHFFVFYF
ncbi:MAG TPA: C4-dicarboxylate ABC transporter, partial [Clostridiales bacterium]|nr:C4-dicarboxylate ABC transporter [Clostridiales bacterium]